MSQERGLVPIDPRHFDNAQRGRNLSSEAREVLDRPENSQAIALTHGVNSAQLNRNPFFLLIICDNTPSVEDIIISSSKGTQTGIEITREAVNSILDGVLHKSKRPDSIYVSVQVLNPMEDLLDTTLRAHRPGRMPYSSQEELTARVVLYPYMLLKDAPRLDKENFQIAGGSTPLYDRVGQVLGSPLYEISAAASFMKGDARSAVLITSDGRDNSSRTNTPEDVVKVVADLVRRQSIVAGIAIGDEAAGDFLKMGIPRNWIFPTNAEGFKGAIDLFTEGVAQATNATREELLMLTAGGFKGITPQP